MSALSPVLRRAVGSLLMYWCPGCDRAHGVPIGAGPGNRWAWNGDAVAPTFHPSVLVRTFEGADPVPRAVCHSFVHDGRVQFLPDSTHGLAGQTVDLPTWPGQGGGV